MAKSNNKEDIFDLLLFGIAGVTAGKTIKNSNS
jgi:hypothetical protein